MTQNLKWRTVVIVVTILLCIFGIIGFPKSKTDLVQNLKDNIRLGLDLKGGSQLVEVVHVEDAVKSDADQVMEHLKADMAKQNIGFSSMDRSDPPQPTTVADADNIVITVKGVPETSSSAFRSLVNQGYSAYVLTVVNATDYSMRMKPSDLIALKRDTVQRTIDTISNRINELGVAESSVQQYGAAGADLRSAGAVAGCGRPGAGARVDRHGGRARNRRGQGRAIPQPRSGAGAKGRRVAAEQQAGQEPAARCGGGRRVVPAGASGGGHGQRNAQRSRQPGRIQQVGNQLHAVAGWRAPVWHVHRKEHRQQAGGGAGQSDRERGHDSGQNRRFRADHEPGHPRGSR
jgi:hypothetical protein